MLEKCIEIVIEVKKKRRKVFEASVKYPIYVYHILNTTIYDIFDPSYEEKVNVYSVFDEKYLDEEDYAFVCRIDNIRYSSKDIDSCIRGVLEEYVAKKLIGLKHYTLREIGGSWGFDIYRMRRKPLVSVIISEPSTTYIVTKTSNEKEHDVILNEVAKMYYEADIGFGLMTSGIITKCSKCGSEVKVTIKDTRCPYCGADLYKQLMSW